MHGTRACENFYVIFSISFNLRRVDDEDQDRFSLQFDNVRVWRGRREMIFKFCGPALLLLPPPPQRHCSQLETVADIWRGKVGPIARIFANMYEKSPQYLSFCFWKWHEIDISWLEINFSSKNMATYEIWFSTILSVKHLILFRIFGKF